MTPSAFISLATPLAAILASLVVALIAVISTGKRLSRKALAGVISISGLYELAPSWNVSDNQRQATEKTFGSGSGGSQTGVAGASGPS